MDEVNENRQDYTLEPLPGHSTGQHQGPIFTTRMYRVGNLFDDFCELFEPLKRFIFGRSS